MACSESTGFAKASGDVFTSSCASAFLRTASCTNGPTMPAGTSRFTAGRSGKVSSLVNTHVIQVVQRLLALYHSAPGMLLNSSLFRICSQLAYRPVFSRKLPEANTPAFRLAIPLTRSKKDSAGHWSRRVDVIHGALAASSSGASQQRTGPGPFGHRRPLSSARHQSLTSAY